MSSGVRNLPANADVLMTTTTSIPADATPGTRYVGVIVNWNNKYPAKPIRRTTPQRGHHRRQFLYVHAESDDAECDRGGADDERHGDAFLLVVLVDGVDGGELDSPESELGNRDGHGGGDDRSQPDRGRALVERHDRGADAERQPELLHGDLQPDFGQFWRWRWNRLGGRHGAERMSLGREQRLHVLAHGHVRGEWYCERHDQLLGRGQQRRCPHWSHLRHREPASRSPRRQLSARTR